MREFQVKHRRRPSLLGSRPVQILLVLILALMAPRVIRFYQQERAVAKEEAALRQELAVLLTRRDGFLTDIARLETNRGVEEAIRERFGVVKPGEKVINLVGAPATTTAATTSSPWWQGIIDWFK